jgi:acetate kinase
MPMNVLVADVGSGSLHPAVLGPVVIDDRVRRELEEAAQRAPLHVPPALRVLDAARAVLPDTPQVACFDSAFDATLPEAAYRGTVGRSRPLARRVFQLVAF